MSGKRVFPGRVVLLLHVSVVAIPLTAHRLPLTAQTPPANSALDLLRDSLARLSDVEMLSADFERLRRADPL
ncbi:MAG TPA: hypothetical protein VIM84_03045, partial [Gemmatimonadales bacterium]